MHAQHVTQKIQAPAQSERALYLATTYICNSHIYIQNTTTLLYKTPPVFLQNTKHKNIHGHAQSENMDILYKTHKITGIFCKRDL